MYHEEFVSILSRSRPRLHHLSFSTAYSRIAHGSSFLLDLTDLEITHLAVAEISDFLRHLGVRSSTSFLPKLESFASSVWEPVSYFNSTEAPSMIEYGDLADALDCRWNQNHMGSRLGSFRMVWRSHSCSDDEKHKLFLSPPPDFRLNRPRLFDLVEEGMQISVIAQVGDLTQVWI
ncbi:hypothetical protein B0H13DRAFT_585912 [Mycena leptocephala]|nr:hypothetical protein B0H13DRAFT_585912 [Mycena leptocephala]